MENKNRLILTAQDAISKAEQELSTSRYIAECTRNPGMRAIHEKRCQWLSVIVGLAKKATNGDTVEVVHGRWIKDGDVVVCSNCGEEHAWDEYRATYCEDCGAKMDGDEDG